METIPIQIESLIYQVRGIKVMIDTDLAVLYEVETRALIQAVKRNKKRFPDDLMFQLTKEEFDNLRSHFVISSQWGGRRFRPYAFSQDGVAMLSSVLKSEKAIQVNIQIIRVFNKLRQFMNSHKALNKKIDSLEKKYDQQFKVVFDAIRKLVTLEDKPKRRIGFHSDDD